MQAKNLSLDTESPVLEVTGLNKRFGGVVVADDINLALKPKQVLGLIGPNGAGKTTLFNLISGVLQPDSGSIQLHGTELTNMPLYKRSRLGIARTWQHMRLFESLTVLDNLLVSTSSYPGESLFNLFFRGFFVKAAEQDAKERALDILARMGLEHIANRAVNDITFGQQKLVGMARSLMSDSDCLLLDEPMAGVEGAAYDTMRNIVRSEAEAGRAICVVEHNVSFIKDLCNSAVFMAQGQILERGTVDDLLNSKVLADLYFG